MWSALSLQGQEAIKNSNVYRKWLKRDKWLNKRTWKVPVHYYHLRNEKRKKMKTGFYKRETYQMITENSCAFLVNTTREDVS